MLANVFRCRRMLNARAVSVAASLALCSASCGGSPAAPQRDQVFYLHGTGGIVDKTFSWEMYLPKLDAAANSLVPKRIGVGVLDGDVQLSRPQDWSVRAADYSPERRFISYQSPRQFIFSIYERVDHPGDAWSEVLGRYEHDIEGQGAQVLAGRIPVATANTQGRSYWLKTRVSGKPDYQAFAHEIVARSDHRIVLVQVVHPEGVEPIADEVVAVLQSLSVD